MANSVSLTGDISSSEDGWKAAITTSSYNLAWVGGGNGGVRGLSFPGSGGVSMLSAEGILGGGGEWMPASGMFLGGGGVSGEMSPRSCDAAAISTSDPDSTSFLSDDSKPLKLIPF